MKKTRIVIALTAMLSLVPAGAALAASDKEDCKKGGWMSLHREDGSSFKNQGACVSYASNGGTFMEDAEEPTVS